MQVPIPYADPLLELLDCIEDAVQLLAFDYFAAAGDELRRARELLGGALADWQDADARFARLWLEQAWCTDKHGDWGVRRGNYAGALWQARRAVRRHWLGRLGIAWDPYFVRLEPPPLRALQPPLADHPGAMEFD